MADVLRRLGVAAWWVGAVVMAGGLIGGFGMIRTDGLSGFFLGPAAAAVVTVPCWLVSYVLAGSFWKPPAKP